MNHCCALQRTDGRWDYTRNRHPTGYCQEYHPIPEEEGGIIPPEAARRHNEKMEQHRHKFHTDGHATEEEARECYKQYLLDTALFLPAAEPENASQQHKCQVCGKWTACHATVGPYRLFVLCPEHCTREHVAGLLTVGESWES